MRNFFSKKSKSGLKNIRRKRPVRRKAATVPSKRFVKAVKSVIHKQAETKHAWHVMGTTQFNSGITASADCLRVLPNIPTGVGDAQRIGITIQAQRLMIKGWLCMNTTYNTSSSSRIAVRLMLISVKRYPNYDDAVSNFANWSSNLLRKGATTAGFTGAVDDLYAPINSDVITLHKQRISYLTIPFYTAGPTAVSSITDPHKTYRAFNVSLPMKKVLKYDASVSSDLLPVNAGMFLVAGYVHLDGSAPDVLNTQLLMSYDCELAFEDI